MSPNGLTLHASAGSESDRARTAALLQPGAVEFPLSSMQESLWVQAQLTSNCGVYNLANAWRLKGHLNYQAFDRAWDSILQRHEALRTVFTAAGGRPVQVILPAANFSVPVTDVANEDHGEARLLSLLQAEARRPFDLAVGPLARVHLFRLSPEEHILFTNLHHLISDEWSVAVLIRELSAHYTAFLSGQSISLPDLPIQYADFAVWERQISSGTALDEPLEYWRRTLREPRASLAIPADHPRPARPSYHGATQYTDLSAGLLAQLKDLARSQDTTLFMVLLAAFKALLWRYTRQEDIVIGSPMAGRDRSETEGLVGFFVHTVALRTQVSGNPTFLELLQRVRDTVLGAGAHQQVPLDKIMQAVQAERDPSRHPLFQVIFGLQPPQFEIPPFPGLAVHHLELDNGGSKFDWSMLLTEKNSGGLRIRCEYSTELFERATVRSRLKHYETLLHGIVAQPSRRVSELPLLTEAERCRVLAKHASSPVTAPPEICLHDWFAQQAASTPEAPAVTCGPATLTYAALNARANQLAHYLKSQGVGPEVLVAVFLERSVELLVAILAVVKAGGAYVPIDPGCPRERLEFMLADSGARLLLTQQSLRSLLSNHSGPILSLDSDGLNLSSQSEENPVSGAGAANAAYIIYTSGSTGKPKGVIITHANVVRLFTKTQPWFSFNPSDVWTLFHSCAFDFSVWEIWGALLYGGRLVIVPYIVSRSPADFYQLLAREGVTVLNQTPSAFRQLISAEPSPGSCPDLRLRYVICGGEALQLQSLKPWFARHPAGYPRVVNMYGITETTVHVTYREIRESDVARNLGSVVGIPIPDLQLYLLDETLQPVPVGVPGEICVGGAGLARGYLNRAELTATRFVPDPFCAGQRLYRSGDLARYTVDGELEYLGRIDNQVKIRGFRVELGEIESALNRHPHVREATVVTQSGPGTSLRLVGYFVPVGPAPSAQELRDFLQPMLPDYMIPAAFMPLQALPLTVNGKVNKRALPAPSTEPDQPPGTPARTPLEKTISGIWCELLGVSVLGIEDNFFQLGGHSLLATQAISRLSANMEKELPVSLIFEAPTVALLAEAVARVPSDGLSPLRRRLRDDETRELLAHVDELTSAELDALLSQSEEPNLLK